MPQFVPSIEHDYLADRGAPPGVARDGGWRIRPTSGSSHRHVRFRAEMLGDDDGAGRDPGRRIAAMPQAGSAYLQVAEAREDLEHLAPRGEHPPATLLVR